MGRQLPADDLRLLARLPPRVPFADAVLLPHLRRSRTLLQLETNGTTPTRLCKPRSSRSRFALFVSLPRSDLQPRITNGEVSSLRRELRSSVVQIVQQAVSQLEHALGRWSLPTFSIHIPITSASSRFSTDRTRSTMTRLLARKSLMIGCADSSALSSSISRSRGSHGNSSAGPRDSRIVTALKGCGSVSCPIVGQDGATARLPPQAGPAGDSRRDVGAPRRPRVSGGLRGGCRAKGGGGNRGRLQSVRRERSRVVAAVNDGTPLLSRVSDA